jgi:hypothetical protein
MTREEAKAFIEEAEKLPANEVDTAKLTEAIEVLSGSLLDLDPLFEGLRRLADNFDENLRSSLAAIRALGVVVGEAVGKVADVVEPVLEDVGRIQTAGPRFDNAEWLARAGQLAREVGDQESAEQADPSDTGGPAGTQFVRRLRPDTARVDRLDPAFRKRLSEAAAKADVSPEEVEVLIGQGMTYLAQVKESELPLPPDSPTTIEQYLETYIEKWEAEGPRPIGVPFDFVASRKVPLTTDPAFFADIRSGRFDTPRTEAVEPQYFEGDELAPQSLDPAAIIHLQKRLVAAGLMDEGDYYAGYWTDVTAAAYKTVLGVANTNGTTPTVALTELIRTLPQSVKDQRARAKQLEKFQADPYIKPDYATLVQRVKGVFRSDVGRDPTAAELSELTRVAGGFDRQSFDAFTEEQRFAFNRAQGITPPALTIGGPPATPVGTPTFQDVDPAARFREFFERRFKPEIDRLASLDDVRRNTNNVFASLRTMSSLVGGGR